MYSMSNEISPVITEAINLMKRLNEGLEVEIVGEMTRTDPSEHYPIGQLGVSTKMTLVGLEENFFLEYQLCEDMVCNPYGHFIAEEIVMDIFKDKLMALRDKTSNINYEK